MRRGSRGRGYGGGGRPSLPHQHQIQNNIPRLLQPLQSRTPPLMADHLQGLKDIDMELELLKRKREIIEQQQILSDSYRQINDYKPMISQGRQSRYDDYARLYDNPRESDQSGGRGEGSRKRGLIPVWESEASAKRYSGSGRSADRPSASRHSPGPSHPRQNFKRAPEPLFSASKHRRPTPPAREKRDFHPSKVSKPSTAPPVKLASYQPAERKRLVTSVLGYGMTRAGESLVLRADRPPSHLMVGRLELALGAVVKDMREAHPQHAALFQHRAALRAVKEAVRERIRTAMVGKAVTTPADIQAAYHQMFPKGQDDDVIAKGLMAQTNRDFILFETASPEVFFKKNLSNLMMLRMEEMITKLNELYGADKLATYTPYAHVRHPEHLPKRRTRTRKSKPFGTETPSLTEKPDQQDSKEAESDQKKQAEITATEPIVQDKTEDEAKLEVQPEDQENDETKNEAVNKVPDADKSAEMQPEVETVKPAPIAVPQHLINNETYLALDRLMTYKMLHLLKRFAPEFLNHMNVDSWYRQLKTSILNETTKKLAAKEDAAEVSQKVAERKPLFYAKVLGKPSLPKRKAMHFFFNKYKPKFIKKHRTVHNLLFVAFVDEESYKNILTADGTAIGRFTLDIKASETNDNNETMKKENSAEDAKTSEADKLDVSTETIIGSDLDEQITDLLTSIRNTDNFAEDIVVAEPTGNKVDKDQTTEMDEVVDCAVEPNANEASEDDVVELRDVPKFDDDVVEINDGQSNVVEINDDAQNNSGDKAENDVELKDAEKDDGSVEVKDLVQIDAVNDQASPNGTATQNETQDTLPDLNTEIKDVKMTPKRASARLATPGGIKTRRMSKLTD